MSKPALDHETIIREYYESNTPVFRWWAGARREPLAIHRRIDGRFDTSHERVLTAAGDCRSVFDLGCGTGAALWWLGDRVGADVELAGVTLSPSQASEASKWLGRRATIVTGSYLEETSWVPSKAPRLVFGIESLAHNPDPEGLRNLLTRCSEAGDRFLLIDDLLARPPENARESQWLEAFRDGWRVPALESAWQWKDSLATLGWDLVADELWTLRLPVPTRLQLWGSSMAVGGSTKNSWAANLVGGAALVLGTASGLFEYRALEWRKRS